MHLFLQGFNFIYPSPPSTSCEIYTQFLAPGLKESIIKLGLSILLAPVITLQCERK